jgi:AraC-like DNA-binding protein
MQRVGAFTGLPALIQQLGVDPVPLLADAGLGRDALGDPEARVSYAAIGEILRLAAQRTRCPHIGLLVGRMWHLSDLGVVGEVVTNSATVGEALRTLTVYQHLNSGGGLTFLLMRGAVVDLGYAVYLTGFAGAEYMYDAVLAAGFNYMRRMCGPTWLPSAVLMPRARPVDVTPYCNSFKMQPRFNAEIAALRFPSQWMSLAVPGSDPERRRAAERRAEEQGDVDIVDQVARALRVVLLHGRHSGDEVADTLAMHRRTLNRRLKAAGTTFQQVLDTVRFEIARQLLAHSDVKLDDVAAALGYAGVTPFMHTFRRWAGTTPDRWRRTSAAARDANTSPG